MIESSVPVRVVPPGVSGAGNRSVKKERKPQRCGKCGGDGHNAMTCNKGNGDPPTGRAPKPKSKPQARIETRGAEEIIVRIRLVVTVESAS